MKPAAHRRDTPALGMPIGRELPAVVKNENYALPAKHLKPAALNLAGPARNPSESASKRLLTATRNTRPDSSNGEER